MTEEENNCLAEKIVSADVERLWNSDFTVLCPEQSAIGTMCEMGILYGWKYMADKLIDILLGKDEEEAHLEGWISEEKTKELHYKKIEKRFNKLLEEISRIQDKKNYAHYFDIRTNHLNEKDWRRSFSINQMLYGMILAATTDHTLHNSFDEILPLLQKEYIKEEQLTFDSEWR